MPVMACTLEGAVRLVASTGMLPSFEMLELRDALVGFRQHTPAHAACCGALTRGCVCVCVCVCVCWQVLIHPLFVKSSDLMRAIVTVFRSEQQQHLAATREANSGTPRQDVAVTPKARNRGAPASSAASSAKLSQGETRALGLFQAWLRHPEAAADLAEPETLVRTRIRSRGLQR